ncbi:MAG TPA: glycerol-3-phosphate 1-O-acyltransferase PlsY [Rhodanobacteraceae bacterium]|jgi:glycerol-3-phosphate acyltransferase PlsY|nr:glycerol-3-phosphate 1-O-acyltransferase PlsY [Rhodanobacteraceae bacterium]
MLLLIAAAAVSYLLGSLSGSLLLGRLRGIDIRRQGSGNAGGTNALRTQGWRFALAVVVIDVGKGAVAAWLGLHVGATAQAPFDSAHAQGALCGFAAIVGHCWPLFFGFRGGKGAATAVGAVLVLAPVFVLPMIGVWALVLIATGYVGLATIVAAVAFALLAVTASGAAPNAPAPFAIAVALLVVFTHRSNIARLARGEEYRFDKARLLHRMRRGG